MSDIETAPEEDKPRRGRPPKTEENADKPKRERRARAPLGGMRMRLEVEKREGYHRHWFNDEPGRVDAAWNNDYEYVMTEDGEKKKELVGTDRNGKPLYAYLMEKPEDWHQEDQQAKQARIDAIDRQIHGGAVNTEQGPLQSQEFYKPDKAG